MTINYLQNLRLRLGCFLDITYEYRNAKRASVDVLQQRHRLIIIEKFDGSNCRRVLSGRAVRRTRPCTLSLPDHDIAIYFRIFRLTTRVIDPVPPSQNKIAERPRLSFFLFLWPPDVIGQAIIFLPCGFFLLLLSSSFFSFPRLISAATDWMSTILLHMAWPSANLECRSEMCCSRLAANTGRKKVAKIAIWAPSHCI